MHFNKAPAPRQANRAVSILLWHFYSLPVAGLSLQDHLGDSLPALHPHPFEGQLAHLSALTKNHLIALSSRLLYCLCPPGLLFLFLAQLWHVRLDQAPQRSCQLELQPNTQQQQLYHTLPLFLSAGDTQPATVTKTQMQLKPPQSKVSNHLKCTP